MKKIFSVLMSFVLLNAACSTFTKNNNGVLQTAQISNTGTDNTAVNIKQIDLQNDKIKYYDKQFRKYIKKHFPSQENRTSRLYYDYIAKISQQKPLAKITRQDEDYILLYLDKNTAKAFTYDMQGNLFGWAEEEILKNTSSELLVAFYDYRITNTNNTQYAQGDIKYILFLYIDTKNKHYVQFIYDENNLIKCAQIDNEIYTESDRDNLLINPSYYPVKHLDYDKSDKGSFPVIEVAEGTLQLGISAAVIASALSYLPAWIWIGYVAAGALPWTILMFSVK